MTAATADVENEVAIITCQDCHFLIPQYARKSLSRRRNLRVDVFTCPTCQAAYTVTVECVQHTNLEQKTLDEIRNKKR